MCSLSTIDVYRADGLHCFVEDCDTQIVNNLYHMDIFSYYCLSIIVPKSCLSSFHNFAVYIAVNDEPNLSEWESERRTLFGDLRVD